MTDKATDKSGMNAQDTFNSKDLSSLFSDLDSDLDLDSVWGSDKSGEDKESKDVDLFSRTDSLSGSIDAVIESEPKEEIELDIDFSGLADGTGVKDSFNANSTKKNDEIELILDDLGASFDLAAIEVSDELTDSGEDGLELIEVVDDVEFENASASEDKTSASDDKQANSDQETESSPKVEVAVIAADETKSTTKADETKTTTKDDAVSVNLEKVDDAKNDDKSDESVDLEKTADLGVLSEEDLDDEPGEVKLSTRAKLGREIRIEDVVEADNEVHEDFQYSEEDCVAIEDPEIHDQNVKRGLISAIVGVLLIGIVAVVGVVLYQHNVRLANNYTVAQNYGFVADSVHWKEFASSSNGKWIAVCNDTRGAVYRHDYLVAQFLPQNGCQGIQISEDGKYVTYVTRNSQLERFVLDKDLGFNNGSLGGVLPGLASNAFSAQNDGAVSYITRDNVSINVVRHTNEEDIAQALPADSLVCFGSTGNEYAYISNLEMHIHREGQPDVVASLDDPKLACPREVALSCAYDGTDLWAVVCRNGYVQGKGAASAHGQYDFTSVATGAEFVSVYRHEGGTEIVMPENWLRISEKAPSNIMNVPLSHKLDAPALFAWRESETLPLIGISGGLLTRIGDKGAVSQFAVNSSGRQLTASAFVNAGHTIVNVFNAIDELGNIDSSSYLMFWDPSQAQFLNQVAVSGKISAVGISQTGANGFLVLDADPKDSNQSTSVSFINWNRVGNKLENKIEIAGKPVYAEWSADEKNCLLKYADGRSELFSLIENEMVKAAELPEGLDVAFHSNNYLWVLDSSDKESPRLRMFSIAENQYGVDFSIAEHAIAGADVKHISVSPYSNNLILWGESGLWSYDVQQKRIAQKLDQPVTWLSYSHSGKSVATNLGIVELASKDVRRQVYPENVNALLWSSDDSYLLSSDASTIYNVTGNQQILLPGRSQSITFLGQGAGIHPSAPLTLSLRDDVTTIEEITASNANILGAFVGGGDSSWCWLAPNGEAQGSGSACLPLEKYNRDQIAKPVSLNNMSALVSSAALEKVASITHDPVNPVEFVDKTHLVVKSIPADAVVMFRDSENNIPEALAPKDGESFITLPFEADLKVSDLGYAAVFVAEGYETLIKTFNADSAEVIINAQLLKSSYIDITVTRHASEEPLSDDTKIALQSFVGDHRDEIKKCSAKSDEPVKLTLDVSENCSIDLSSEFKANDCLEAAFDEFKQPRSCARTSGLAENAFDSFDVVLP